MIYHHRFNTEADRLYLSSPNQTLLDLQKCKKYGLLFSFIIFVLENIVVFHKNKHLCCYVIELLLLFENKLINILKIFPVLISNMVNIKR